MFRKQFGTIYVFIFRLKCNERIFHDEDVRLLRKQVDTTHDYRILIAKQEANIAVRVI